ncbi:trimeric intracellular cation channel family protein [Echinicola sp. CAU 1574]|uniref:Trimeric intracellular cation channel family protein n=1 Tax=Echinicola arenosa TaxID=2774144 RepID=A0ABR9ALQ0_9BACT|nr:MULTISPECIES: trimeric intracellular cation channel family protein [Echinicola]MBD8488763.1 trimeric intracellular cation channel family protein [Echinicola arenosa]
MDLLFIFDLVGTFFFAVSGALAVKDREHDVFGAGFTGFITAIGGGTLRDVLLDSYPLVWINDVRYLYAIFGGILTAILFFKAMSKLRKTLFLFDTLGIALFSVLGAEKALSMGVAPEIAAMMGMFSAVMGGVIRDMLTNDTPILMRKEVYASACLAGAILFIVLFNFGVERNVNLIISFLLVVVIRLVAVRYKLSWPQLDWKK